MDVRLAETFLKVAELGNVTKGAEALGYSQTAVTLQIKQLEEELGIKLFDRVGRHIQLTRAGTDFIPYAAELVRACNDAASFAMDDSSPAGTLRIISGSSLSVAYLPGLVGRFHTEYPNINFDIQTLDSREAMIEGLKQNTHDFFFDTGVQVEYDGLSKAAERLEELVFVCSKNDPLTKKRTVRLSDIFDDTENHPFIFHGGPESEFSIETLLLENDITVESRISFSSPISILSTLREGTGRSLLPRFIAESDISTGDIAILKLSYTIQKFWSQMFYNSNKWVDPAMAAFIDFVSDDFAG